MNKFTKHIIVSFCAIALGSIMSITIASGNNSSHNGFSGNYGSYNNGSHEKMNGFKHEKSGKGEKCDKGTSVVGLCPNDHLILGDGSCIQYKCPEGTELELGGLGGVSQCVGTPPPPTGTCRQAIEVAIEAFYAQNGNYNFCTYTNSGNTTQLMIGENMGIPESDSQIILFVQEGGSYTILPPWGQGPVGISDAEAVQCRAELLNIIIPSIPGCIMQ